MPKLSDNQAASLEALKTACANADYASAAVWRKHCPPKISVHAEAMVKTGSVKKVVVAYSINGKTTEMYAPV